MPTFIESDVLDTAKRCVYEQLVEILDEMEMLRTEILNRLEAQENLKKTDANDDHFGRHIQNSKSESIHELEPRSDEEQGAKPAEYD